MMRHIALIFLSIFALIYGCPTPPQSSYTGYVTATECGDYGMTCCEGGVCYQGECQGGMCIHCGGFGEKCCNMNNPACAQGAECVQGFCKVREDWFSDCGHWGFPPCYNNGEQYCYSGIVNSWAGICEACGEFEEPCCIYTDYPCSFGTCTAPYPHTGGVCRRDSPETYQPPQNSYDQPAQPSTYEVPAQCGHLDEPCCQDPRRLSPMGAIDATPPCFDGLECYGDVCVNGPEYEAYDPRASGMY